MRAASTSSGRLAVLLFHVVVIAAVIDLVHGTLGPNDRKKSSSAKKKLDKQQTKQQQQQQQTRRTPTEEIKINEQKQDDEQQQEQSVDVRGLVRAEIASSDELIRNHGSYCNSRVECLDQKHFGNAVLGYVTPWNARGYDLAKIFAKKLDYVSPVWLQIKRDGRHSYSLTGTHDIDAGWMQQVRDSSSSSKSTSSGLKFVPRVLFEKLEIADVHALFNDEEEIEALAEMLGKESDTHNFDGFLFEIYMQLGQGQSRADINHIVEDVARYLHERSVPRLFFLVVPPPYAEDQDIAKKGKTERDNPVGHLFDKRDYEAVKNVVDGFSLMTYDYNSHNMIIGPNAPLKWVERNVRYYIGEADLDDQASEKELEAQREEASKMLTGLNMYGLRYWLDAQGKIKKAPEPLVGAQLIKLLEEHGTTFKIQWDPKSEEHIFYRRGDDEQTIIFFPTLYSIKQRLELATRLGTGVSIWEMGQGLDYFYDLL